MSANRHSESPSMMAAAMPFVELERWLQNRADRRPVAISVPMLDGYVAAIVAGPVSIDPLDSICPLIAVDADAINHSGTPEFAAICAAARRHNDISRVLSTTPDRFEPMHRCKPNGDIDPRPWCWGFYAAMRLRMSNWAPLLDTSDVNHSSCRSSCTATTIRATPCSDWQGRAKRPKTFCVMLTPISQRPSSTCANTGCRPATLVQTDQVPRGSSCRLRLSIRASGKNAAHAGRTYESNRSHRISQKNLAQRGRPHMNRAARNWEPVS